MPEAVPQKCCTDHTTESMRGGNLTINWTFMSCKYHLGSIIYRNKQISGSAWSWELVPLLVTFSDLECGEKWVNTTQNGSVPNTANLTTGQRLKCFSAHKVCIYPVKFLLLSEILDVIYGTLDPLFWKMCFGFSKHFIFYNVHPEAFVFWLSPHLV